MRGKKKKFSTKKWVLRRKYPHLYFLLAGAAMVMFWWGVWGLLDTFIIPRYEVVSFVLAVGGGAFILYLDDFSLKELIK